MPRRPSGNLKLRKLARKCEAYASRAADSSAFVSVSRLAAEFEAEVVLRPLLVEAMLASIRHDPATHKAPPAERWKVLLDSETFPVSESEISSERAGHALPVRVRNTIAHELAHILSFRTTESGVEMDEIRRRGENTEDFIKRVERETEKLSPLLLIPSEALACLPDASQRPVDLQDLQQLRNSAAVSREVLISRLKLHRQMNPNLAYDEGLMANIAIGLAEWKKGEQAVFRNWPIFTNFRSRLCPTFIAKLGKNKRTEQRISDLLGGRELHSAPEFELELSAGTQQNPALEMQQFRISFETVPYRSGRAFLYLIRAV